MRGMCDFISLKILSPAESLRTQAMKRVGRRCDAAALGGGTEGDDTGAGLLRMPERRAMPIVPAEISGLQRMEEGRQTGTAAV